MPWSEEVLVTVSDLEDKKNAVRELRDQVAELQSNNDYSMRMKDIAFQEQLKKLTERYTSELEAERQQYELLREEKLDTEREYTERLNSMEVSGVGSRRVARGRRSSRHSSLPLPRAQLSDCTHIFLFLFPRVCSPCCVQIAHRSEMQKRESLYQGKIMDEVDRYQSLQSDVENQRAMWRNKRNAMLTAHNQFMQQLTVDNERRLEGARDRRQALEDDVVCGFDASVHAPCSLVCVCARVDTLTIVCVCKRCRRA
ncbi:hypothetical protein EON66_07580 [archaeon]|nr:MAG: hypothetical protein EON66_07580 [archaeon]